MIQQTLLPIKLERMEPKLTPRSGLFLYAEFIKAFGVDNWIMKYMPKPGSGRGYEPLAYIKPLSMMMYGGGTCIDDIKEIREDEALRKTSPYEWVNKTIKSIRWLLVEVVGSFKKPRKGLR